MTLTLNTDLPAGTAGRLDHGPPGLMDHQRPVFDFVVNNPYAGIWLDVGGGKTLTILRALQYLRPVGHILVIAPVAIARTTWIDEIEKWKIPIKTKSLIVDDQDRLLSKKKRLARFEGILTDPPTMYFVNQELLTQPSQDTRLLVPTSRPQPAAAGLSPEALDLLGVLTQHKAMTQDDLTQAYREAAALADPDSGMPSKTAVGGWVRELVKAALIERVRRDCASCAGDGCQECQFGLIDQLPIDTVTENGKTRRVITWPFPTVVIDESQAFKSASSRRFKAMRQVRPAISRLIELTGTPSPNGLEDLWSQVYLLDEGQALGTSMSAYRKRWFTPTTHVDNRPVKWEPRPGAEDEIHQAVAHLVMSARNTSLSMPTLSVQDVPVALDDDLLEAYRAFKRELVLDIVRSDPDSPPATVIADNRATLAGKLLQFASGTMYTADPDVPSTAGDYEVIHEAKLDVAEQLVRSTVSSIPVVDPNTGERRYDSPVLMTYHFRSDKAQLLARLRRAGFEAEAFDGSREMTRRWNARQIPVMLLHPASAGHGLNFQQGGHTLIWYTLTENLGWYTQTNGRLYRTGQTKPVTVYRLITTGTQDARMPMVLSSKQAVQDRLIDAVDLTDEWDALNQEIADDLDDLNDYWRQTR